MRENVNPTEIKTWPQGWWKEEKYLRPALDHYGSAVQTALAAGTDHRKLCVWAGKFGIKLTAGQRAAVLNNAIGDVVSQEELLRHEVAELRKQVASARKLEVFDAKALHMLERYVQTVEPTYKPPKPSTNVTETAHTHVLMWSDLHAAERVSYEAMNGLNEYNWGIMNARLADIQRGVLSFKRHRPYPINDLYILGLGDQVTGDIHDELRETNEENCTESAVKLGLEAADWVAEFGKEYSNIYVSGVVGNHGRITPKPEFKNATKNWDWIVYKVMQLRLASHPHIHIEVPSSFEHIVTVYDKNILMFHGDGIPSNMPGIPWGGVVRRTKEMGETWYAQGVKIDHFALGHFHEGNVVAQGRIWVNGSVKGPDEYSRKKFGGGRPPCQLLHTFHPGRGYIGTDYLMAP